MFGLYQELSVKRHSLARPAHERSPNDPTQNEQRRPPGLTSLLAHYLTPKASRRAQLLFALSLSLTSLGCGTELVNLKEGTREYVSTDYESVLRHWTRNGELIVMNELDNVLNVTSTYESWDFRWAYVIRYASDYRLTVSQRQALLERSLGETREHHQFYLALYAKNHKWADLASESTAWIVRLVDEQGTETAPSEIIPIARPGAIELTYYPYTSPWRRAFRVKFPKINAAGQSTISANAKWFGLRFAGAQGHQELRWELEASE